MESYLFILLPLLGFLLAALGTLIGAGGGFLLVPILLLAFDFPPQMAVATSLFMIFANSASGTIAYLRQGRVELKVAGTLAAFTIPGAIVGAFLLQVLATQYFRPAFALLLVAVAILLIIPRREKGPESGPAPIPPTRLLIAAILSLFVGVLASLFGIGGGVIHVPVLIFVLGFAVHRATATSHFTLMVSSLVGTLVYLYLGDVNIPFGILLAVGALGGAQVGAHFSKGVRPRTIVVIVAIAILLVAVRLLWTTLSP